MKKAADVGNFILRIIIGIIAVAFLAYGGLMLRDMYLTEISAFASYDLMKYRPNIEEDQPPYLDELVKINKDTRGWLTIYGTHIDYPVMQGKTGMEYINKDVYGEYSVTGSIFMASKNAGDFSDPYTLVYGHHMTNGSMFGDLHRFKEKDFFDKNKKGILIRTGMAYDLEVMAFLETDAYDEQIYDLGKTDLKPLVSYLRKKADNFRDVEYEKILALSTCYDAKTMGRTVLVCAMKVRTAPLPDREYGRALHARSAMGHPMAGAWFGLLNLVCLMVIVVGGVRMIWTGRKKVKKIWLLAGVAVMALSILFFILTEDPRKPIQMVDSFTPVMLGLLLLLWLAAKKGADSDQG